MGQKVNPHGLRVGVIKDWDSKWYANKKTFADYCHVLQMLRYRQGQLTDYTSRLHYFSDWIIDNTAMGFVREVQQEGLRLDVSAPTPEHASIFTAIDCLLQKTNGRKR